MFEEFLMNDGERVFICSDRDILEVVEQYCGYDFMKFIENKLEDKSEERTALDEELRAAEMETAVNSPAIETVNHPAHYQGKHECIDEMISLFGVEAVKGFCKCNVYKYRYRASRKNGAEDIAKADWYMQKLIELESDDK